MATKPSDLPRWADVSGDIVEPSSGKKDVGWVGGATPDRPPAQYFNWLFNKIYQWTEYLDTPVGDAATGSDPGGDAFTATGGAAVNGTAGAGLKGTGGAESGSGVGGSGVIGVGGASNGAGGTFTGNGTAPGAQGTGGATSGDGLKGTGGTPNGRGVVGIGTGSASGVHGEGSVVGSGAGVTGTGGGVNGNGGVFTGIDAGEGVRGTGGGNGGNGGEFTGGATNGDGVRGTGGATNGRGVVGTGTGSGVGVLGTGGATNGNGVAGAGTGSGAGVSGTGGSSNGAGVLGTGGATNGDGVQGVGTGAGSGVVGDASGGTGHGVESIGNSTSSPVLVTPQSSAPSSPAKGSMYADNVGGGMHIGDGTNWLRLVANLLSTTENSDTETTTGGGTAYSWPTITLPSIPAGVLRAGSQIRARFAIVVLPRTTEDNFNLIFPSAFPIGSSPVMPGATFAGGPHVLLFDIVTTVLTVGAGGTCRTYLRASAFSVSDYSSSDWEGDDLVWSAVELGQHAFNTTAAKSLTLSYLASGGSGGSLATYVRDYSVDVVL